MYALFNSDKQFIGYSPDIPSDVDILKKEISVEHMDFTKWKWEGDYDTGQMIPLSSGPNVEELHLNMEFFKQITRRYSLGDQLFNIIRQLKKIVDQNQDIRHDEFYDMADFMLNAMDKYQEAINYHKSYSNFKPIHESEQQLGTVL